MLDNMQKSRLEKIYLLLMVVLWTLSYDIFYDLVYLFAPAQWLDQIEYALLDSLVCLSLIGLYGAYYHWSPYREKTLAKPLTLQAVWQLPILALAIGGIASLWFNLVDWFLSNGYPFPQTLEEFDQSWEFTVQDSYLWVFLSVVILGPIVEEILFRGIIYDHLQAFKRPWLSILISAVLFALWHRQPVQIGYTFFAGLIFATARYYSGGLLFPIIIHVINNLMSTLPDSWYEWVGPPINVLSYLAILPAIYLIYRWFPRSEDRQKIENFFHH